MCDSAPCRSPKRLNGRSRKRTSLPFLLLGVVGLVSVLIVTSGCSAPPTSPVDTVKLLVDEDGVYAITSADLRRVGVEVGGLDLAAVRILNQGQEVPFAVAEEGSEPSIVFYGQESNSVYSRHNVYWLYLVGDPGRRMEERAASPCGGQPAAASFLDTVRREEDLVYAAKAAPGSDHWYWRRLIAPEPATLPISLEHLASGEGTLRLSLMGYTSDAVSPDHHLRMLFNGCLVDEARWDGQSEHLVEASLPFSCMEEGENLLELEAVADTGAQADIVMVDWWEVDYHRYFVATQDELEFVGHGGRHVLDGFSDGSILLLDVTSPLDVALVTGPRVEGDGSQYTLSFCDGQPPGHRYVAVSEDGLRTPSSMMAATPTADLRSSEIQADYVVVTNDAFEEAIQPLVEWRRSQGLSVEVVRTSEVYDQFSYGLVDPAAIRDLLRYAHTHWQEPAPQYVLLVGDASYDYRDYLNGPNKSFLPSHQTDTVLGGQTSNDNWFVTLDDEDILPDMAMGRLPVQTAEETRVVVDKIIAYEQSAPPGDWRQRVLLVADGQEPGFAALADALADESVPDGFEVGKVYAASVDQPQGVVARQLAAGSLLVNYTGHGSIDAWSEDRLFSSEQVASLRNGGRQPMMIMMSCLLGFFDHPERQSLSEELLLAEDGGAIAVFAPSSLTLSSDQGPLDRALVKALLSGEVPTVGLAIMEAKRSLPFETQGQRDVIETFTLFSDPALRLVSPD
jgi:hypothetical protein